VYLAADKMMDRKVVLKVVAAGYLGRSETRERFIGEIRAAAKLDHPNVVKAHTTLQLGETLAFVMEFVDGEDLHRLVQRRGPLPIANACYYAYQTALGLQHAHEKGMVHRDIKPHNLMLTRGKKQIVKILDFGLAKATTEKGEDRGLTADGQMLGTPDYIAPEQTLDAATASIHSDIYSLGCTLHYLLTGKPPFKGNTAFAVLQAHHIQEAADLAQSRPDAPGELGAILQKMMAKQRTERYQTPGEVAAALLPFFKSRTTDAVTPARTERAGEAPLPIGDELTDVIAVRSDAVLRLPAGVVRKSRSASKDSPHKTKIIIGAIAATALLFGGLVLWGAGVFRVRTTDGILVLTVDEPGAEVIVDGDRVTVTPDKGGQPVEIRVRPGDHDFEIKKNGFSVFGTNLSISDGQHKPLHVTLERLTSTKTDQKAVSANLRQTQVAAENPWLSSLRRQDIPAEAIAAASATGEAGPAPPALVAVLGGISPIHNAAVRGLAFSPDGRWLASSSEDKTILLWEVAAARARRVLKGHTAVVSAVVFDKSGGTIVSASFDGTIKLWPVADGSRPQTLSPGLGEIRALTASSDGKYLAAGGAKGSIKLWKWGQWNTPRDFATGSGAVQALSFSRDGETLASGWRDDDPGPDDLRGPIRLYKTADATLVKTLSGHEDEKDRRGGINALAFSPDGTKLASTGADHKVKVWDLETSKVLAENENWCDRNPVAITPDGRTLVTGPCNPSVELFDLNLKRRDRAFSGPWFTDWRAIAISSDGQRMAFGTGNGCVIVRNAETWEQITPEGGHTHYLTALSVSPDGRRLLTAGDDDTVLEWSSDSNREIRLCQRNNKPVNVLNWSPDGKQYVTSANATWWDNDDRGIFRDYSTGIRQYALNPTTGIMSLAFSPNGKLIAGSNNDQTSVNKLDGGVALWDATNGKQLHQFERLGTTVAVAFSSDGKLIAAGNDGTSCDGTPRPMFLKVWDAAAGTEVRSWPLDTAYQAGAFRPGSRQFASGHADGSICVWDVDANVKVRTLRGHSRPVKCLRFTPDGSMLVSTGSDGTVRVWNPDQEPSPGPRSNRPVLLCGRRFSGCFRTKTY
jgi:WD40 repeat protein